MLQGRLGRLMLGVGAFELGNVAATLLILRATDLLDPGRPHDQAVQLALLLYTLYNAAAALTSVPAGRLGDRRGMVRVLAGGVAAFHPRIGVRTAGRVQAFGNLVASSSAGLLYTLASPAAAFTFAGGAMIVSLALLAAAR